MLNWPQCRKRDNFSRGIEGAKTAPFCRQKCANSEVFSRERFKLGYDSQAAMRRKICRFFDRKAKQARKGGLIAVCILGRHLGATFVCVGSAHNSQFSGQCKQKLAI